LDAQVDRGRKQANDAATRRNAQAQTNLTREQLREARRVEQEKNRLDRAEKARLAKDLAARQRVADRSERAQATVNDPIVRALVDDEQTARQQRKDRNERIRAEARDPNEEAATKALNERQNAQAKSAYAMQQLNPLYSAQIAAGNVDARRGNAAQRAADARYSLRDPAAQRQEASDSGLAEAEKRKRNAQIAAETERQTIPFLREIVSNEAEAAVLARRREALLQAQVAANVAARPSLIKQEAAAAVDTRRNQAAQGAEEARYSASDPLARNKEINDQATKAAQDRKDSIQKNLEIERQLEGDSENLAKQVAETEAIKRRQKLATREAEAATHSEAEAIQRAAVTVKEQANSERQQLELLRAQNAVYTSGLDVDKDSLKVKNQILIEQRKLRNEQAKQIKQGIDLNRATNGEQGIPAGTRFQRLQQSIASRGGQQARLPEEFQTMKQFVESKALTTAGFAFSGAILYGGISAIKEMIQGASELQKELSLVEGQFINTGRSAEEFGKFKDTIIDISKETGIAAQELAKVGRSLLGVFRIRDESKPLEQQDQGPNVQAAQDALGVSAKFSAVTGVDSKTITDEFVAVFKSFEDVQKGITFQSLADSLIAVEEESGVAADQLLNIAGSLAPVVSQMGVSTDELIRYSAAATQGSARDPSAIADGLNRFLTDLPTKTAAILDVYQQGGLDTGLLQKKIASGDTSQVIEQIIRDYQKLSPTLKQTFNEQVIGKRDAQSVVGLFENPTLALRDIKGDGKLEERFAKVQDTLTLAITRAKAAVQEFATALFDAGLGDVLKNLATVAGGLVVGLTKVLNAITWVNDHLPGPTQGKGSELAGAIGAGFVVNSIIKAVQARAGTRGGPGGLFGAPVVTAGVAGLGGTADPTLTPAKGLPRQIGKLGRPGNFVANNAGLIGASILLFGGQQFLEARAAEQAQQKEMERQLSTLSDKRLQEGLDLPEDSFGQRLKNYYAGGKSTSQKYNDEIQKRDAARKRDVLSSLTAKEYNAARGTIDADGKYKSQEDLLQNLRDNPMSDDVNNAYEALIKSYESMGVSDAYKDATKDADVKNDVVEKGREAADSLDDSAKKVDLMIEAMKTGDSTLGEVRDAIGDRTAKLQAMVDGAIAAGKPDPELEKALAESKAQDAQVTDLAFKNYADLQKKIMDLRGDNGPQSNAKLQEINRFILSDFGNGISDEYRTTVATDLADLQKKAVDYQIGQATSVMDAISAYNKGNENYDPVARFEIIKSQVGSELNSNALGELGGKDRIDEVTTTISNYLKLGRDESVAWLRKQIESWNLQNEILKSDMFQADIDKANAWISILMGIQDPSAFSQDAAAATAKTGFDNARALIQGQAGLANSQTFDPLAQAQTNQKAAADTLAEAKIFHYIAHDKESEQALIDAQTKYYEAVNSTIKSQDAIDTSELAIAAARVAGDPLASARVSKQAADLALAQARGDKAATNQAIAAGIAADKAIADAQTDIGRARLELVAAQNAGDPVAAAQAALNIANYNVANAAAGDEAARLRALAAQIGAKNALSEAIANVLGAFYDVAIATREAAGDAVGAAELQLQKIDRLLSAARGRGDKSTELQLIAQKVSAEANLRDTQLSDRTSDIDFALQMEKITTGQAIQQLELLLKIPNLTKQQIQELQLKIKSLRDGSGVDQFNMPEKLDLPTAYSIKRLDQLNGGTYQSTNGISSSSTSNVDARTVNITINAKNTIEAEAALKVVSDELKSAPRSGVDVRIY
jgi:hypothetical protein